MSIVVTPFVYLLSTGMGIGMCSAFILCSATDRMAADKRSSVSRADKTNIALAVIITSLFLLWSTGSAIAAYFSHYAMFEKDMPHAYNNLQVCDVFVDIVQKALGFGILALCALQAAHVGEQDVLIAWTRSCMVFGIAQFFLLVILHGMFHGPLGWVLMYMLSALMDIITCCFAAVTLLLVYKSVDRTGMQGYFACKVVHYSTCTCAGVLAVCIIDLIAKTLLSMLAIYHRATVQLLVDTACMFRSVATFAIVLLAYSAKIPSSKSYGAVSG